MPGLVGVLVVVGMVAVVPLGLRRLGTPGLGPLIRLWPVAAVAAAIGLLLPRGLGAVAAVLPYAAACVAVTAAGALRAMRWAQGKSAQGKSAQGRWAQGTWAPREWVKRGRAGALHELVALTATASLSVAGLSLIAERAGYEAFGFSLPVLGLTVAHFHFAGFAAALMAGLTADAAPSRPATCGMLAVPLGTAIVAVGHFTGRGTELLGAVLLTTGLLATSWVAARHVATTADSAWARRLLLTAAWATPVTMGLAVAFALGRATGLPHLSIAQTAATHGVVNALGVALCGLLAWSLIAPRRL